MKKTNQPYITLNTGNAMPAIGYGTQQVKPCKDAFIVSV